MAADIIQPSACDMPGSRGWTGFPLRAKPEVFSAMRVLALQS